MSISDWELDAAADAFAYDAHFDPDDDWDDRFGADDDAEPQVDGWEPGETLQERNERILGRNQADRERDQLVEPAPGEKIGGDALDAPVHRFDVDDAASARRVLTAAAVDAGMSFADLVAPIPRGRLSASDKQRRDVLACAVAEVRERGATVHVVATVTGRALATVHLLEQRGRALRG